MEEGSGRSGGGGASSSSCSTLLCGGGRQRFEVELKPGETTIVSWKKLLKDANKAANTNNHNNDTEAPVVPAPPVPLPVVANPALDSRIAPPSGNIAENEANDAPNGSRFSAVIEKIERLYMGKNSSDEEDLNDVPDDDEYDTEDSFIDDTELDDYFQVDNSAIKHDGFFVNRGKLERTNEPTALPSEQQKKRRRKDSTKGHRESDDGHAPNKHMRVNKKAIGNAITSVDKNPASLPRSITLPTANSESVNYQSPIIALGTVVKRPDPKTIMGPSPTRILNGEARVTGKNIDKQKTGVLQSKKQGPKLKDGSPSPALPIQRPNDKGSDVKLKSQGQLLNNSEELNLSVLPREKSVIRQQSDMKSVEVAHQPKNPHMVRKEGSSAKPKSTSMMLEKAIKDLENIVAESRPPSMEVRVPDADNSSQGVKRRMPPEIKQRLAKVARLAHSVHGKLSKELLNRLMGIVGHLIQIRSLKRNLQNMVNTGLSAKEEKDARMQQLKKEVDEMVKARAPMMKPKAIEQQAGSSADDFQEPATKDKLVKSKFTMDDALEDKICDLYDLFVEGLDEDAGPQVRKLYAELAEAWPKGLMDNHGIKRAICRAKERRKTLYRHKEQEKLKRKKLLAPRTETLTIDTTGSMAVPQRVPDKPVTDSTTPARPISNSPGNVVGLEKQPKGASSSNNPNDVIVKKKAKRKAEGELVEDAKKAEPILFAPPQPPPQPTLHML